MSMSMPSYGAARTGLQSPRKIAGYDVQQMNRFSPEQMQLFQSLIGGSLPGIEGGINNLSRLASGDEAYFKQLEAPALRQFSGLQGQLASRFSGMGLGARKSSGHALAQNEQARAFAEQLQSQRLGLQQNAIQSLLGLSQNLLGQQPYEQFLTEPKRSRWEQFAAAGLPILGGTVGGVFGGPLGATIGSSAGSAAGKAFLH